jgi:hypothetical protein
VLPNSAVFFDSASYDDYDDDDDDDDNDDDIIELWYIRNSPRCTLIRGVGTFRRKLQGGPLFIFSRVIGPKKNTNPPCVGLFADNVE